MPSTMNHTAHIKMTSSSRHKDQSTQMLKLFTSTFQYTITSRPRITKPYNHQMWTVKACDNYSDNIWQYVTAAGRMKVRKWRPRMRTAALILVKRRPQWVACGSCWNFTFITFVISKLIYNVLTWYCPCVISYTGFPTSIGKVTYNLYH